MSAPDCVRVEDGGGGVRSLILDRPPVNALGAELVEGIAAAIRDLAADPSVRCLIVRSAGRHFCGGADLKERVGMTLPDVRSFVGKLATTFTSIANLPFPTIAAIRGAAVGGGCVLALACDLRLLAEDATIGLRETALAILPGAGGTQRLPRLIGPAKAKRWIFTAKAHGAVEALADGVADRVVPASELDHEATRWAESIAAQGPIAIRLAKEAIDGGLDLPLPEALRLEWRCYESTLGTSDREEGLRAFSEKRPPRFEGR